MKQKVLAYIIRNHKGRDEILIHEHRDEPEAGVQVPAGTVEIGESLETALYREIFEETGLKELELLRKLESYIFFNEYKRNTRRETSTFYKLQILSRTLGYIQ